MSISVDDLVASFSGSHIGQEAIDLATLQAQLAQTLFSQQIPSNMHGQNSRTDKGDGQPCNTPTARTPSSSFGFGQIGDIRRGSSSSMSRSRSRKNSIVDETWRDVDEMDEDEQMVEDLLTPSSPSIMTPNFIHSHSQIPSSSRTPISSIHNTYAESPSASLFTTTDPFYMAQLQALQNPQPTSIFAQSGRPAQHSPFFQHSRHHSQHKFVHSVPTSTGRQG